MADRVAVTFAATNAVDMEGIEEQAANLPPGLSVSVRVAPLPAMKAASPDDWRSIVQFVIGAGPLVDAVAINLVSSWLYDVLKGLRNDGRRGTVIDKSVHIDNSVHIDRSVHNYVRVFAGHGEINETDLEEITRRVTEAIASAPSPTDVPPELTAKPPRVKAETEAEWVQAQIDLGRRHDEEMARLIERTKRRHPDPD